MPTRPARILLVAALATGSLVALAQTSSAVGTGTFTRITTPASTTMYAYNGAPGATNHVTIAGQASLDVTSVDIKCIVTGASGIDAQALATAVPVTAGNFSVVATFTSLTTNCRLRAIPNGVDVTTDYLGSYAGPLFYAHELVLTKIGSTVYGYSAAGEQGSGIGLITDAATCGAGILATIATPSMEVLGSGQQQCAFTLPEGNVTSGGTSTQSSIRVSGHNAYLPATVHNYLNGDLSLGVTQTPLTTTFSAASNGDVTVTEAATLMRCSVADTYPPTHASCPALVSAGVRFTRTVNIFRGAHEIRVRDRFAATDGHAHPLGLQYQVSPYAPPTGAAGFTFPNHSSTFAKAVPDQVVTGLGTKAASVFIRSDIDGVEGDPAVDAFGLTWSRAPSDIRFAHGSSNLFAMPYSVSVPAGGSAYLGFAEVEAPSTSGAKTRARVAATEMVSTPTISSPRAGASIHGTRTTVKGTVALGANGLVKKVTVNGHAAHLTISSSQTYVSYSATFAEAHGAHTVKVTATDAAGNASSRAIRVKNG
ncbi:MAG: hypothetical protein JWP74_965 [Marmoricola sp.]|nr:hypothetical protein [Marmoricola sp.]